MTDDIDLQVANPERVPVIGVGAFSGLRALCEGGAPGLEMT
ncbi:hypothetical protein [Candidatus Rhodoblastus alkanivorans]|nr:hypothetical protein [Candidatus Rhodoblastus alkanivorans]